MDAAAAALDQRGTAAREPGILPQRPLPEFRERGRHRQHAHLGARLTHANGEQPFTGNDDERIDTPCESPDAANQLEQDRLGAAHFRGHAQEGYAHRRPIIATLSEKRRGHSAAIASG